MSVPHTLKCSMPLGLILKTKHLFKVKNKNIDEFRKLTCC